MSRRRRASGRAGGPVGVAALAILAPVAPASAAILSATEAGVVIERTATVAAPPARVWAVLIAPARWWSSRHSWSGHARNFTLAAQAGGCFCEALPDGGSVEHMRVVFVRPGKLLRMTGGLGPLQADAATGPLTVTLEPAAGGTTLVMRYAVAGVARMPLPALAPVIDGVLGEQVRRLQAVAEGRDPDAAASTRAVPAARK